MSMYGKKDHIEKLLCSTLIGFQLLIALCATVYGRGRLVPPDPRAPKKYEAQLQKAETVEGVEKFLSDIGDLPSLDLASAQMLALQKLSNLHDKDGAVDLLSRIYHEDAYVHSASLSPHVELELIRTLGKIGTSEAKAELFLILDQALELEKNSVSAATSQLNIINATMRTLAEGCYKDSEVRERLKTISIQFAEHGESVRTYACKYYLIAKMKAKGVNKKKRQVNWLLGELNYDAYEKNDIDMNGDVFTIYKGNKGTWPGLKNEAIKEVLKELAPEVTDHLKNEQTQIRKDRKREVIEFLIQRTLRMKTTPALNFLKDIIVGPERRAKWWGSKIGIPEEKMYSRQCVSEVIDMLQGGGLRYAVKNFGKLDPADDKARELQEFIVERSSWRFEEIKQRNRENELEDSEADSPEQIESSSQERRGSKELHGSTDRHWVKRLPWRATLVVLGVVWLIGILIYKYGKTNS